MFEPNLKEIGKNMDFLELSQIERSRYTVYSIDKKAENVFWGPGLGLGSSKQWSRVWVLP